MTKTSKIYKGNETNLYGIIPNIGSFAALIQIHIDFDYNSSLPAQLLEECCLKGLGVLPQFFSPISLEEHYDQYNNKINIVVNKDKVPHCVIRLGQSIKDFYLTPLR
jgi:hypothetical protein